MIAGPTWGNTSTTTVVYSTGATNTVSNCGDQYDTVYYQNIPAYLEPVFPPPDDTYERFLYARYLEWINSVPDALARWLAAVAELRALHCSELVSPILTRRASRPRAPPLGPECPPGGVVALPAPGSHPRSL